MKGKVLLTGYTSGIGKALYDILVKEGYEVVGMSRRNGYDVSKWESWEKIINQHHKSFDYLILNAGIAKFTPEEEYIIHKQVINTNLLGVYYPLHNLESLLKEGGVCAVTASSAAYHSSPEHPLYSAVKTAVVELVKSYTKIYNGKYRLFAVSPGLTLTNLGDQNYQIPEEVINNVPLKRYMTAEEMAEYYYTLLTKFKFLNGSEVVIDGGEHA